jgi:hypothetical protein
MLHLLTEDTRVITVTERRDATDNCGGVVCIPSIIWVQSRLANWPTWRYSKCKPSSLAKCRSSTANKSATASSRYTAWPTHSWSSPTCNSNTEDERNSVNHETAYLWCNTVAYYRVQNSSQLYPFLIPINLVHILKPYFFRLAIISSFHHRLYLTSGYLQSSCPIKNLCTCIFLISRVLHVQPM